jgi:putative FmdB family regulatory protein
MPLYEYQCESCGRRFEQIRKFSDPAVETCPTCGGNVRKLVSSPAFHLKGTGWYATDYSRKDKGQSSDAEKGESSTSSSADSEKSQQESKESKGSKDSKESKGSKDSEKVTSDSGGAKDSTGTSSKASTPPATPPKS